MQFIQFREQPDPKRGIWVGFGNLVAGVFLAYITLQNISYALTPSDAVATKQRSIAVALETFGKKTMTIQQFRMFDVPPLYNPWFEYTAELDDGTRVDLFSERPFSDGQRPGSVYRYMKSQYWRRIHWNLATNPELPPENMETYEALRARLLDKVVQDWNRRFPERPVKSAILRCHMDPIVLGDEPARAGPVFRWATYERGRFDR